MRKALRNHLATALGLVTSICTAWAVVDFDALDYGHVKTYIKLFVVAMPAVGGYLSVLKDKDDKNA